MNLIRELARQLLPALSDHQRRLAAACILEAPDAHRVNATHLTQERLARYLERYFSDPLSIVRRQNDFIRALKPDERKPFFRQAPLLNYLAEREAHVRPYDAPSRKTHEQKTNVGYLFHGDLLPGSRFDIDRPSTHDREYLKVKKESRNTLPYSSGARQLAVHPMNFTQKQMAHILMDTFKEKGGAKEEPPAKAFLGAGSIIATGDDVCRHKVAMLVQSLQEAGIEAHYVRGGINNLSGKHVWAHACLDGTWHRLDPQWGVMRPLEQSKRVKTPTRGNPLYAPDVNTNVVWRRKRRKQTTA